MLNSCTRRFGTASPSMPRISRSHGVVANNSRARPLTVRARRVISAASSSPRNERRSGPSLHCSSGSLGRVRGRTIATATRKPAILPRREASQCQGKPAYRSQHTVLARANPATSQLSLSTTATAVVNTASSFHRPSMRCRSESPTVQSRKVRVMGTAASFGPRPNPPRRAAADSTTRGICHPR
ncbi:hypothetical protein HRbin36_02576 [bacterium HR36]|nr:hypothetical protein HRbin36_02576 [bacterium HR36]